MSLEQLVESKYMIFITNLYLCKVYRSIKTEAVFFKAEINNEWNIFFEIIPIVFYAFILTSFLLVEEPLKVCFYYRVKLLLMSSMPSNPSLDINSHFRKEGKSQMYLGLMSMDGAALTQSCVLSKTIHQKVLRLLIKKYWKKALTHVDILTLIYISTLCEMSGSAVLSSSFKVWILKKLKVFNLDTSSHTSFLIMILKI